ncbi:hypothetical protein [Lentzea sp. NEAU-D7]|uniref:hypothetical protein n=1 Tax=Lentzea sp. NEAU-D7 TaxID=2994667 RepID=UPI00224B8C6A|nr:hypothetical protein [Lentzea sp. NEAU-D7]MCX2949920.1 hypothetical protein [Lentzea sp. NEAU-D7]
MTEPQFDVLSIAKEIATELGDGWSASPGQWENKQNAFLTGPDGLEFHFRFNHYASVTHFQIGLSVRGLYRFRPPGMIVEIQASVRKTPEEIAGDIKRQLLPRALPVLGETLARKRAHDEEEAAIVRRAESIRSALGDRAYVQKQDNSVRLGGNDEEMRVEVDARYERVCFTVETTPERAILLAQAIGQL